MSDRFNRAGQDPSRRDSSDRPRVCVVGNLTIDLIVRSVPALPGWGQEVVGANRSEVVAGQAGYLAFAASRLGLPISVVSTVGDDPAAERIRSALRDFGVDHSHVETIAGRASPLTVAVVRPDGERAFISDFACLDRIDADFLGRHWDAARGAAAVALVGVLNLPRFDADATAGLLARAREAGAIILLDTGWDPQNWAQQTVTGLRRLLAHVDLFIPNLDEARALTGAEEPVDALRALAGDCAGTVVIKAGADGSWSLDGDGRPMHVAARPVPVDNAVGAGDVYNAGFLAAYLERRDLAAAMAYGTAAAAFYVSRAQDRFPTPAEVDGERLGAGASSATAERRR